MRSILKTVLLITQFLELVYNFKTNSDFNEIESNYTKKSWFEELDNSEASLQQRIDLCKANLPKYDYEILKPEDQDVLFNTLNPCRVDCVIYVTTYVSRTINTYYFRDGKTKCGQQKVCVEYKEYNIGKCESIQTIPTITQTITTPTIPPTTTTTNPTTKLTANPTANPTANLTTDPTANPTANITRNTTTNSITKPTTSPTANPNTTPLTTEILKNWSTPTQTVPKVDCLAAKYYRDPKDPDCMNFYRCVNLGRGLERVNFRCTNGTVFDEPIQVCQHPDELNEPCPKK